MNVNTMRVGFMIVSSYHMFHTPSLWPMSVLSACITPVGHSKGGNNVLLYASQYDGDVEFIINVAGESSCKQSNLQLLAVVHAWQAKTTR